MVKTDKGWDPICTSPIKAKVGDLVITRSGSAYALGKINPEYETLYPNARERLFSTLPTFDPDAPCQEFQSKISPKSPSDTEEDSPF